MPTVFIDENNQKSGYDDKCKIKGSNSARKKHLRDSLVNINVDISSKYTLENRRKK